MLPLYFNASIENQLPLPSAECSQASSAVGSDWSFKLNSDVKSSESPFRSESAKKSGCPPDNNVIITQTRAVAEK